MSLRICLFALAATAIFRPAAAADHPPYVGYVNADEVYARSGPGKNYYPTEKLARGTEVEVYRHDPGGWFAIRPPQGSFSWVSGEFLQPTEGQMAVASGDRVVVRVGSQFSDIRDVIQVRLNRGEEVEIFEAKRFNAGPAAQTWYRIASPAGEFRWVHGKFVDREPPQDQREPEDARRNLLVKADEAEEVEERDELARRDDRAVEEKIEADESEARLVSGTREEIEADDEADAEEIERERRDARERRARKERAAREERAEELEDVEADHEDDRARLDAERAARRRAHKPRPERDEEERLLDDARLRHELRAIDLELSAMVAEDPSRWHVEALRARAENVLTSSETAIERGRARLLLGKIERFADIHRRWETLADVSPRLRARADLVSGFSRPAVVDPAAGYDGVGRLARVRSELTGAPSYALTDAAGAIRYYVTPAPGLNLGHYLGREVGVSGTVGFLPELNQQEVTAQRVTVLADPIIRR